MIIDKHGTSWLADRAGLAAAIFLLLFLIEVAIL